MNVKRGHSIMTNYYFCLKVVRNQYIICFNLQEEVLISLWKVYSLENYKSLFISAMEEKMTGCVKLEQESWLWKIKCKAVLGKSNILIINSRFLTQKKPAHIFSLFESDNMTCISACWFVFCLIFIVNK